MSVTIRVKEESLSGDLCMMPPEMYVAEITDINTKLSKSSQQPVSWVTWVLKSEPLEPIDEEVYPDLQGTTTGKKVLESYSLQENAIWRLNTLFKTANGENLPIGQDYSMEEFNEMLKERLVGFEANIQLEHGEDDKGNPKMEVSSIIARGRASAPKAQKGRTKGKRK